MAIDISGYATQALQKPTTRGSANPVPRNDDQQKNIKPGQTESVNVFDSTQKVKEMIADATGINQEKVDHIKAMIADGSYQVNADRTAERMLNFELNLLG